MDSVFVHAAPNFNRDKPFINEQLNEVFSYFLNEGSRLGLTVYLSKIGKYNPLKHSLRKAWVYEDYKWKLLKHKKSNLMYYRGKNMDSLGISEKAMQYGLKMVNHPELEVLCDDKVVTSMRFPEISPKTFLVNSITQLQKALYFIPSRKVVLKPRFGSFGNNVVIMDKHKLRGSITRNTLLQEFIDTSSGIKQFNFSGYHDLRVMIIDGKIDHAYVRIAPKGSYTANMTRGATKKYIPSEDLPNSVLNLIRHIDSEVKHCGARIYSADFMFDSEQKPWLVEMNSKPGTMYYDNEPKLRQRYYRNIFKCLKRAL